MVVAAAGNKIVVTPYFSWLEIAVSAYLTLLELM
jgi:hypothetical protein